MKEKGKKIICIILMILIIVVLISGMIFIYSKVSNEENNNNNKNNKLNDFNNKIIHAVHNDKDNYMISPYSLEVVLSMLRDGASSKTYEELNELVPERDIKYFESLGRINIANGLFIKKGISVKSEFKDIMKNKYKSELIYDKFDTPDVINNWVNEKTFGMIPSILEEISPNFLLGISNAIAIDNEWGHKFKCSDTRVEKFNKLDNSHINVAMMHNSYKSGVSYYDDDDKATYVSIPYVKYGKDGKYDNNGTQLEFIGILPDDNINDFIETFDINKIDDVEKEMIEASNKLTIDVSLPRFSFKNDFDNLSKELVKLGLVETFGGSPSFDKIANYDMFISSFIHKTFIELNENGTKAAAVTFASFDKNSIVVDESKHVNINFDKPFIYLIKDKDSSEILFYGVLYTPDEYDLDDELCPEED